MKGEEGGEERGEEREEREEEEEEGEEREEEEEETEEEGEEREVKSSQVKFIVNFFTCTGHTKNLKLRFLLSHADID